METRIDQRFESRLKDTESRFEARLKDMEARLEARFDARLDGAFTRFSQHILNKVGSRFEEVKARFDSVDARLKLQAGLIQLGTRAMARFSEFSESSE
jgi:DNA anti-recombination protein RmuC